jgi:hypothetical protein
LASSEGLVLELLDGYVPLAGPPSFASVTRDVYAGDGSEVAPGAYTLGHGRRGAAQAPRGLHRAGLPPWPGEARLPARAHPLRFVVGVLRSASAALAALHARGVSHGDVYGHNVLLRPRAASPAAARGAAEWAADNEAAGACDDGWAVLSDLGAAFFYKAAPPTESGAELGAPPDAAQAAEALLLERVEVLAFGHLAAELVARLDPNQASDARFTWAVGALRSLAAECRGPAVAARPAFAEVHRRICAVEERGL